MPAVDSGLHLTIFVRAMQKLLPLLFILFVHALQASSSLPDSTWPHQKNKCRVVLQDGSAQEGYILAVTDSSLQFLPKKYYWYRNSAYAYWINGESVKEVNKKFRRGFTTGGAILSGLGAGAALGIALTTRDCPDPNQSCNGGWELAGKNRFLSTLIISLFLGGIGALVSLFVPKKSRATIRIDGKRENIKYNKIGLMFY